jgi:hypothetical protein
MDLGNLMQMLAQSGALNQIAGQTGESPSATQSAISAILPTLVGAVANNAQTEGGLSSLMNVLDSDHDGSALDDIAGLVGGTMAGTRTGDGAGILSHLLGGDHSGISNMVSQQSGVSSSSASTMMQILAPVVMNYIGQQKQQQGLDASSLIGALINSGGQAQQGESSAISGLMGMIDMNRNGSSMDEIMSIGGSLLSNFMKR